MKTLKEILAEQVLEQQLLDEELLAEGTIDDIIAKLKELKAAGALKKKKIVSRLKEIDAEMIDWLGGSPEPEIGQ